LLLRRSGLLLLRRGCRVCLLLLRRGCRGCRGCLRRGCRGCRGCRCNLCRGGLLSEPDVLDMAILLALLTRGFAVGAHSFNAVKVVPLAVLSLLQASLLGFAPSVGFLFPGRCCPA
jgi:hypothetical protein